MGSAVMPVTLPSYLNQIFAPVPTKPQPKPTVNGRIIPFTCTDKTEEVVLWTANTLRCQLHVVHIKSTPGLTSEIANQYLRALVSKKGYLIGTVPVSCLADEIKDRQIRRLDQVIFPNEMYYALTNIEHKTRGMAGKLYAHDKITAFMLNMWAGNLPNSIVDINLSAVDNAAKVFKRVYGYDPMQTGMSP